MANVIIQNLTYIVNELQTLTVAEGLKNEIIGVCQTFTSTLYDVNKEIRNLEDKLGMHPDDEPFDSSIVNPDPKVTMGFIDHWISREVQAMHKLVVKLQALAHVDGSLIGVKVLVMESATNILNAYKDINKELSFILEHLDKVDSA